MFNTLFIVFVEIATLSVGARKLPLIHHLCREAFLGSGRFEVNLGLAAWFRFLLEHIFRSARVTLP